MVLRRFWPVAMAASAMLCLSACEKKDADKSVNEAHAAASAAPPSTVAAPLPASAGPQGERPAAAQGVELSIGKGTMSFLIDAPAEKIKGRASDVKGAIRLDPNDLTRVSGEIGFKLTTLTTETFKDKDKNDGQTEHARNWMEVGPDSPADAKAKNEWSRFVVKSVEASPSKLADAPEANGARTVRGKVTGDLLLHGITLPKTIAFVATIKGPVDAPTEVVIKSDGPLDVSLKAHDIKPRDKVGTFLNGALEKIGQKIDDRVQVSLEVTASK